MVTLVSLVMGLDSGHNSVLDPQWSTSVMKDSSWLVPEPEPASSLSAGVDSCPIVKLMKTPVQMNVPLKMKSSLTTAVRAASVSSTD